jgi:hypothetical protein
MPPTTRTPNVCNSFSANRGDPIQWGGVPASGCTISQDGSNPWPFSVGPPIHLPTSSTVTIKSGLATGTYSFNPECCTQRVIKTVQVG